MVPFFLRQPHKEVVLNVSTVGRFWAEPCPEPWLSIQSSRGLGWGRCQGKLGSGLLSSQPQAPLDPPGLEDENLRLTGPGVFGGVGAG